MSAEAPLLDRIPSSRNQVLTELCWTLQQAARKKEEREFDFASFPPAKKKLAVAAAVVYLAVLAIFWWGTLTGVPHDGKAVPPVGPHDAGSPLWSQFLEWGWCALIAAGLLRSLRKDALRRAWSTYREIRPLYLLQNAGVIVVVLEAVFVLGQAFPWLDRSWLYLLPGHSSDHVNIALLPAFIPWLGLLFVPLLLANLPRLAEAEEEGYRRGTRDWKHATWRSIRFGLAHCWMGVPLHVGLALSIGGLWFTYQYFRGGVRLSTLHHTTYNLILILLLGGYVVQAHLTHSPLLGYH